MTVTATLESGTVKALAQPTPPAPPATVAETGLHPDTLAQLMMKTLVAGEASGSGLAESLRLPYSLLEALVQARQRVQLIVSDHGLRLLRTETDVGSVDALRARVGAAAWDANVALFDDNDRGAAPASGESMGPTRISPPWPRCTS